MATITLARPDRHTVVRSFAGHLDVAPDAIFRALAEQLGAQRGSDQSSAGQNSTGHSSADQGELLVDTPTRTVIVQGAWWYRGEYRVRPEETGTLIEYEIVNVAPTWHWAGPIAGRREIRDAPRAFQALLTEIAQRTEIAQGTDPDGAA